jgi:PDZ domain-containing protein
MLRKLSILVPVAALVAVLGSVSLPAFSVGPGPPREVGPLIEVSGHPSYPPDGGRLILTSVVLDRVTLFEAIAAWLDPSRSVVSERDIIPPGRSEEDERERAVSQMDQSKVDATVVVLSDLTEYPEEHGRGVLVESVLDGCPAEGKLFPGDLIVSVNGAAISDPEDLTRMVGLVVPGEALRFQIEVEEETRRVALVPSRCTTGHGPLVGIVPVANFPFAVTFSSGDIGGPSAGLMWALGLYDVLTPGDLTGGLTIAGTGDIDVEGNVRPIGGIEQKVIAAERAGAEVFILPLANLEGARTVAGDLRLVPVITVAQALGFLEDMS